MNRVATPVVWDLPVRLFHWGLAAALGTAWWAAETDAMGWHRLAGYTISGLVLFRIAWGFLGKGPARFSSFVAGPRQVGRYLRGPMWARKVPEVPGHNPLGGWNVLLMLGLLVAQVSLGLVAVDVDGLEAGPFSYLVSFETARAAAEWHEFGFNALLAVTALHVVAVVFHVLWKRDNLVGPMLTGRKRGEKTTCIEHGSPLLAVLIALLVGGAVWSAVTLWGRI